MSDDERLIVCSCHTHAVRVSRHDGEVYVSTWRLFYKGGDYNGGWRERLRLCWHVLRTGEAWDDELTLSPQEARRFAVALVGAPENATIHSLGQPWVWTTTSSVATGTPESEPNIG